VYNIKVTTDYFSYNIQKRFSLFLQLRNDVRNFVGLFRLCFKLKDKYPDLRLNQVTFPAKTYFSFGGTDIETIEKRRLLLNGIFLYYFLLGKFRIFESFDCKLQKSLCY